MNDLAILKGKTVAAAFRHLPIKSMGEGIVAGGFPVINYRGKVWSLRYQGQSYAFVREDDGTQLSYIDVIVLGVSEYVSKVYYPPGEWDEDSAGPPVCAAVKGDRPDPGVPEPQSKLCGICPHNAWKTLPNSKRGKECQDHKRLAVLIMPKTTEKMLGQPLLEPAYLKVPPGSLVPLKQFGDSLAHAGFPTASVVTRIGFSTDPKKLFQMTFGVKQVLTDKEAPLVLPLVDDPQTKRITGDQPDIYEVDVPPVREAAMEETGILAAFNKPAAAAPAETNGTAEVEQPVKRGRGRPRLHPAPAAEAQAKAKVIDLKPVEKAVAVAVDVDDDDDVTELDDEVATLLSRKVGDMLK
jgi:hypothetical protein